MSPPAESGSLSENDSGESDSELSESLIPSAEQLEVAENILSRLNPNDRNDIGEMIHLRALICGGIFAGLGIFWWLTILRVGDGELNQSDSMINNLNYITLSWALPLVVFIGSILNAASRERGHPIPGLVAGVLFLFTLFFVAEPLTKSLFGGSGVSTSDALWQTVRLSVLSVGVFLAAKLFIEAFLLNWVKKLEESYAGIELMSLYSTSSDVSNDSILTDNEQTEPNG